MRICFAAALLTVMSGCAELRLSQEASGPPNSSTAPRPSDVETYIAEWGRVRAAPEVLATFPQPLWAAPDPNRTVEPCRRAIERASTADGPAIVQAAGRGPERRNPQGHYEGAVEVRVIYDLAGVRIVRQATMRCITRADGTFLNAEVLPDGPGEPARSAGFL